MSVSYFRFNAAEAQFLMQQTSDFILLDVRERSEYAASHIPHAINLPLGTIELSAQELLPNKDATILVYCQSGRRSALAAGLLAEQGYTDVIDFGGIDSWPYAVVK